MRGDGWEKWRTEGWIEVSMKRWNVVTLSVTLRIVSKRGNAEGCSLYHRVVQCLWVSVIFVLVYFFRFRFRFSFASYFLVLVSFQFTVLVIFINMLWYILHHISTSYWTAYCMLALSLSDKFCYFDIFVFVFVNENHTALGFWCQEWSMGDDPAQIKVDCKVLKTPELYTFRLITPEP